MITGVVTAREARIQLSIRGPRGRPKKIKAVVDTGFTGALTLPATLIAALRLPWQNVVRGTLADGSMTLLAIHQAIVVWDGTERTVLVVESQSESLIGMQLLEGFELRVQVRPKGKVTLRRLS